MTRTMTSLFISPIDTKAMMCTSTVYLGHELRANGFFFVSIGIRSRVRCCFSLDMIFCIRVWVEMDDFACHKQKIRQN